MSGSVELAHLACWEIARRQPPRGQANFSLSSVFARAGPVLIARSCYLQDLHAWLIGSFLTALLFGQALTGAYYWALAMIPPVVASVDEVRTSACGVQACYYHREACIYQPVSQSQEWPPKFELGQDTKSKGCKCNARGDDCSETGDCECR